MQDSSCESAPSTNGNQQIRRLMRLPACLHATGLGRTAWLDLVKAKKAPQPVKIGRATMWVEAEVSAFIEDRIKASREGH